MFTQETQNDSAAVSQSVAIVSRDSYMIRTRDEKTTGVLFFLISFCVCVFIQRQNDSLSAAAQINPPVVVARYNAAPGTIRYIDQVLSCT